MFLFADHSFLRTRSPTAAELLQTPFFRSAKKKSYLVGTILNGLPPLTMRQERRPEILKNQRTTDSWDFNSTTISSQAPSLNGSGPRTVQKTKTLSITSEHNHKDEPETRGRFTTEPSQTTSPLKLEVVSPPHPTIPIPMARSSPSHSSAVTPQNSTSLSTSPSLWDKLTRRSSRNALVDEESPKGKSISRFLGRRGSSSMAQRPIFSPS